MARTELKVTLADETEIIVSPTLEDRLRFETTLRRNKNWGQLEENGLKMMPFEAWSVLHRTGQIDLTWEEFTTGDTAALSVSVVHDDDAVDDEEEVAGLGKGSPKAASRRSSSPSPSAPISPPASGVEPTAPSPAQ